MPALTALLFALFVITPVLAVIRGAAIQLGWYWFLAPLFPHLRDTISLLDAVGLSLIVSLLTLHSLGDEDEDLTPWGQILKTTGKSLVYYLLFFILAVIVHALR